MESASRHIMENEDEKLFKDWITSKREAVEEGVLNTYVQYYDMFISNQ
jgi:hypothetical protein